jgi:histidine triad (HIT) family protein
VNPDCVFCDERKIKSLVDYMYGADGSTHFVFEPLDPVVPGHLLVVPSQHVQDATEEPLVTSMAAGVAARVAQRYRAANIITSIGVPATQSITHLHWHVVPRRHGDGLLLPWSVDGLPSALSPRRGHW